MRYKNLNDACATQIPLRGNYAHTVNIFLCHKRRLACWNNLKSPNTFRLLATRINIWLRFSCFSCKQNGKGPTARYSHELLNLLLLNTPTTMWSFVVYEVTLFKGKKKVSRVFSLNNLNKKLLLLRTHW